MIAALLAILLLQPAPTFPRQTPSVELRPPENAGDFHYRGFRLSGWEPVDLKVDLDPGQDVGGYYLVVSADPYDLSGLTVEWRYETTAVVNDEGPSIALTNWKHFTSPWQAVEKIAPGVYRLPGLTREQWTRFPPSTADEFYRIVLEREGARWADLIKGKTPHDPPALVLPSSYQVRVWLAGSPPMLLNQYTFMLALGC